MDTYCSRSYPSLILMGWRCIDGLFRGDLGGLRGCWLRKKAGKVARPGLTVPPPRLVTCSQYIQRAADEPERIIEAKKKFKKRDFWQARSF